MVYIASDGSIREGAPWGLSRLFAFFWAFFNAIIMFFKTLINPDYNKHGNQYTRDYKPGNGPPRPPRRRMGGFGPGGTVPDCSAGG
ncbi:Selenoprotein K [Gryllus bimaculatus]|nr:Selenoprotein K [Gryllus bimaculatus]